MPYNNTAIPPSEQVTGATALPCMYCSNITTIYTDTSNIVTRVKRIVHADDEIHSVSSQAAFVISAATVSR